MPTLTGHLSLEAERNEAGHTVLARQSFRAPFHLSKPYDHGPVLQVQVVNPTAGMLEGDRLELDIRVGAGAALWVTTPSQARAFRAAGVGGVECRQTLAVEPGGWLDWWPEALVPHAGCDYRQETRIDLAPTAALFFCDAIGPGRVARGETWAWRRLVLGLTVTQAGRPILRERFDLAAEQARGLAELAGQPQAWLATCAIVGVGDDEALWSAVRALHSPGTWVGASRLPGNAAWSLRLAAADGQKLRDTLTAVRQILSRALPGLGITPRRV